MAAGLGFKDFTTGEVLTAADVDSYLMQGIWVFASAAARDAAVTSPQEGNFAYLKDTNVTTYYTGSAWANLDTTGMTNPMTTTGDTIYSSSGSTAARLGIGSTGQVLTVAAGVPSWATPAGAAFVGAAIYRDVATAISNATWTTITWDTEDYDTDGFWASSPNATRVTIPSGKGGKYLFNFSACFASNASGVRLCKLQKNGTDILFGNWIGASGDFLTINGSGVLNLSASDYIEMQVYQSSGGNLNINTKIGNFIMATYLGA